jgi:excisionase family DNA binding protein
MYGRKQSGPPGPGGMEPRRGPACHTRRRKRRPWLSTTQVARRCGVCAGTVRQWIDAGLLRGYRVGRQRRVYLRDLQAFRVARNMTPRRPQPDTAAIATEQPMRQLTLFDVPAPVRPRRRRRRPFRWPYDRVEGFPLLAAERLATN